MKLTAIQSLGLVLIIGGLMVGAASPLLATIQRTEYWEVEKARLQAPAINTPSGYYMRAYECDSEWARKTNSWMPIAAGETIEETAEYLRLQTRAYGVKSVTFHHETSSSYFFVASATSYVYEPEPKPPTIPEGTDEPSEPIDLPDANGNGEPIIDGDGEELLLEDKMPKAVAASALSVTIGIVLFVFGKKLARPR